MKEKKPVNRRGTRERPLVLFKQKEGGKTKKSGLGANWYSAQ